MPKKIRIKDKKSNKNINTLKNKNNNVVVVNLNDKPKRRRRAATRRPQGKSQGGSNSSQLVPISNSHSFIVERPSSQNHHQQPHMKIHEPSNVQVDSMMSSYPIAENGLSNNIKPIRNHITVDDSNNISNISNASTIPLNRTINKSHITVDDTNNISNITDESTIPLNSQEIQNADVSTMTTSHDSKVGREPIDQDTSLGDLLYNANEQPVFIPSIENKTKQQLITELQNHGYMGNLKRYNKPDLQEIYRNYFGLP